MILTAAASSDANTLDCETKTTKSMAPSTVHTNTLMPKIQFANGDSSRISSLKLFVHQTLELSLFELRIGLFVEQQLTSETEHKP